MGLNIAVLATGVSSDYKALEQAFLLKDKYPESKVAVFSIGACAAGVLREAMYRGADEALASDSFVQGCHDVVLCGCQCAEEIARLTSMTGLSCVVCVRSILSFSSGNIAVECVVENSIEESVLSLPVFASVDSSAVSCRPRNAYCLLRHNRGKSPQVSYAVALNAEQTCNGSVEVKECKYYQASDEGVRTFVKEILRTRVLQSADTAMSLKDSSVVVVGGYGVGSKETFDRLFELAHLLHGNVGATRPAVDAGYATRDRMIGQTGVVVRPELYIAFGVSGHTQHLCGVKECGVMISVNKDVNAPINTFADYAIIGDAREVIDKIITYCQQEL